MSNQKTSKLHRTIRLLKRLVPAAVAAALLAQPDAAAAMTPLNAQPPAPAADPAASSYAADYSVSLTEARRRLDRIQPLQEILASIRSHESARLAGWGINHSANFGGWVWLTGDNPPSTDAAGIAAAHADVQIRTGADHSLAKLLAVQQGLFRNGTVGRVNDSPTSGIAAMVTFTGIDMATNAVRIGIDPALAAVVPGGLTGTGPATVSDETFRAKATEVTAQFASSITVNYVVEDGRDLSNHAIFMGGETIGLCTSGFTALQRGAIVYGIITAGHCTNTLQESLSMHGVALLPVIRRRGPSVDAQFQSIPTGSSITTGAPHWLLDDYVCRVNDICDVSSDASKARMMGNYVCHYGVGSGHSCGTIDDISFSPSYPSACDGKCYHTFVRVNGPNLRTCSGDSGGPWYIGGIAYGIHKGGSNSSCTSRGDTAIFSAIRDVENSLGVDILTKIAATVP